MNARFEIHGIAKTAAHPSSSWSLLSLSMLMSAVSFIRANPELVKNWNEYPSSMKMIAMHSKIYGEALKNNEIQFFKPSDNSLDIPTYKEMGVILDDFLTTATPGVYQHHDRHRAERRLHGHLGSRSIVGECIGDYALIKKAATSQSAAITCPISRLFVHVGLIEQFEDGTYFTRCFHS
jgi:hypothetical protein